MGLMHLGAGQAIMLLVSLLLLWLAIAKKFEPLLLLPIGFGGLLSNIPEAGWRSPPWRACWLTTTGAAGGDCREAPLRAGRPRHQRGTGAGPASVQGADGEPRGGHGLLRRVLAIFYKVAIGSGIAPLSSLWASGDDRFRPAAGQPAHPAAGGAAQFGIFATVLGALTLNYFGIISFTLAAGGGHRHHRRRRRSDGDLPVGQAGAGAAGGHRGGGVLLYGAGAADPAADHEGADHG
ncbi:oxaloacetate decarboxylase subunit beta [Klebsiella pneumoniae]|uniref:oxaloacetate decarboxylase (Na(+) extruding) n=1 Tax=Klebsiella pneumoniae TaxID=573 RepID=A0A377VA29_KLEPN|nr:oxaloacetate decarboxylase subunit beta [Klebsiella pneumoniae]